MGAFVNFGADYLEPGRIFVGGRGALYVGELDGRPSGRLDQLVRDLPDAKETANILGFLWAKEAYGAMLFATAVSDLSIADALAEPRYRGVFVQLAQEVLAAAPVPVEPFDGFDADDLDGSIDRLVEFNRRSAKTHSGIYRDLTVRKRRSRDSRCSTDDRRAAAAADARADPPRSRTAAAPARWRTSSCSPPMQRLAGARAGA